MTVESTAPATRSVVCAAFALVLLATVGIRLWYWPAPHEIRDADELGYAWGSLQLLEGNLPGIHYAPAGPQTWVGWSYEGLLTLKNMVFPDSNERKGPLQLRPFLAINRTVFESYRDTGPLRQVWVVTSFICSLGGAAAGFRLGLARAGVAGAVFLGGTMAFLPLFVDFSVQARPYIAAWSLGIMALYYTLASSHPRAPIISSVLMGLAIGSRIDLAMLLPVVWSQTWKAGRWKDWLVAMVRYHVALLIVFFIVAPWYMMTLVACLRAVGTIRGSSTGLVVAKPIAVFLQVMWEQGMLLHLPLFLFALGLWLLRRPRQWLLAIYVALAGLSMLKGAAFGLRYQGAPLILVVLSGLYAIEFLRDRSIAAAMVVSVVALVLPGAQTLRMIVSSRHHYVPDLSTQWVEQHVPVGSIIYLRPWIFNPLPTAEAADTAWAEVADTSAYQRKFKAGLQRFGFRASEIPRALSEVNLALERANRRFLFILGGRLWVKAPRFDTRVFQYGQAFGIRDLPAAFKETGGVVILRGPAADPLALALGVPTTSWLGPTGEGTRLYCSPDVAAKLRN